MTRIDRSDIGARCWRTDHNIARILIDERERAHEKHLEHSIEAIEWDNPRWLGTLMEEVGEVAHWHTYDADHDPNELAKELIQVAAVATAQLDAMRVAGVIQFTKLTQAWLA